jgi:hypothetical protein
MPENDVEKNVTTGTAVVFLTQRSSRGKDSIWRLETPAHFLLIRFF